MIWEVIICCLFGWVFLSTMATEHTSIHTAFLGGRKSKHDFLNFSKLGLTKAISYNCCIYLMPNCGYRAALWILLVHLLIQQWKIQNLYFTVKLKYVFRQYNWYIIQITFRITDIIQKANEYNPECHLHIWYWFAMFVITASFHQRADLCRSTQHMKKL